MSQERIQNCDRSLQHSSDAEHSPELVERLKQDSTMSHSTAERDALCTIAMAAAQLRDLSYRELADETREAHNILATRLEHLERALLYAAETTNDPHTARKAFEALNQGTSK